MSNSNINERISRDLKNMEIGKALTDGLANDILRSAIANGAMFDREPNEMLTILFEQFPFVIVRIIQLVVDIDPIDFVKQYQIDCNKELCKIVKNLEDPLIEKAFMEEHAELRKPRDKKPEIFVPEQ